MGRPPKLNLNYSTWDVDVLENDTSIESVPEERRALASNVVSELIWMSGMRKTGKTRDEIRAMMDAETWVDARRAVELGLVDEVMGGDLVAADVPGLLPESVVQKTLAMFRDQNAAALAQAKTDYENLIKKGVV